MPIISLTLPPLSVGASILSFTMGCICDLLLTNKIKLSEYVLTSATRGGKALCSFLLDLSVPSLTS